MATNAKKPVVKYVDVMTLVPIPHRNNRFVNGTPVAGVALDTMDTPKMIGDIIDRKGISDPLKVNEKLETLQGNRRATAGQAIKKDADKWLNGVNDEDRKEILANLSKVPVLQYIGLTESEELDIINDHGERKDLSRTELIKTVFRLKFSGMSNADICNKLYYLLARYTKNEQKVAEMRAIADPNLRKQRIYAWLKGSVDQYILYAFRFGPRIQDALLRTEMIADKIMPLDESKNPKFPPEFKVTPTRMKALWAAFKQDESGQKWNNEKLTGPAYEKLIQDYKDEDAGIKDKGPGDGRMKKSDMETQRINCRSSAFRVAFGMASGVPYDGAQNLDEETARLEAKIKIIEDNFDSLTQVQVNTRDVFAHILRSEVDVFDRYFRSLCVPHVNVNVIQPPALPAPVEDAEFTVQGNEVAENENEVTETQQA